MQDQEIKQDADKNRIDLVPFGIVEAIGWVRTRATLIDKKYPDSNSWKLVTRVRLLAAMLRHVVKEVRDPGGVDEESGMPHTWHIATNLSFIIEGDMLGLYSKDENDGTPVAVVKQLRHMPFSCPVCRGSGEVPKGFYRQTSGTPALEADSVERCKYCDGVGYVVIDQQ